MATIQKINQPVEELRERICIGMEEWYCISKYESNTVIVDKEPTFGVGAIIEIAGGKQGELASVLRIVKDIEKKDNRTWIITLSDKGEFRKKVSVITLRLNAEEAQALNRLKKSIGKKTASETLKYLIREFPRWNQITKEIIESAKTKEAKYEHLKKLNREFMLAFQDIVQAVNEED